MDSATQFILGASLAGLTLGPKLGPRALLIGGALGTLPDLDAFIPMGNPIDDMTYHRGFSHSVIVLTALSPALAYGLSRLIKDLKGHYALTLLAVWLCLVTHPMLDALTTYGTQILWPFGNAPPGVSPLAFPAVFIIDPVYTLILLTGIIAFLRWEIGYRTLCITLAVSTAYLAIGAIGHISVRARAESHPAFQGKQIHVQPTPFNILGWQVLGVDDKEIVSALAGAAPGCSIVPISRKPRLAKPPMSAELSNSVARLEWFTDGFFDYRIDGNALIMSDLRIGFAPSFVFSFKIAETLGGKFKAIVPERYAVDMPRTQAVSQLLGRMVDTLKTCG